MEQFKEAITERQQLDPESKRSARRNLDTNYVRLKHKLESRLPAEISITSDMQMTPNLEQKVKN